MHSWRLLQNEYEHLPLLKLLQITVLSFGSALEDEARPGGLVEDALGGSVLVAL